MGCTYSEKSDKKERILTQNLSRKKAEKRLAFLVLFVFILVLSPVNSLRGATTSGQATISISAVVPFNSIFAEAVAINSTISLKNSIIFVGQDVMVTAIFSNGEDDFKNQNFRCDLKDSEGMLKVSYAGKTNENKSKEFAIAASSNFIGRNILECQTIGYEKPIQIKQKADFIVLPTINKKPFNFLASI